MRSNRSICRCLVCDTEFTAKPSQIARGRGKYCSTNCRNTNRTTRYQVPCEVCSEPFTTYPSRVAIGGGRFCSKTCEGRSRITAETRLCQRCGANMLVVPSERANGRGVYCSLDCRDDARRGVPTPNAKPPHSVMFPCEYCGQPFRPASPNRAGGPQQFCSYTCKGAAERTPILIPDDERDLIYMAGIIDGEGTISAWLRDSTATGRSSLSYRVIVPNSYAPLMQWIHETFEGSLSTPRTTRSPKHKPVTVWYAGSHAAVVLCRLLLPYLKVKRRQAEIVIELAGLGYTRGNGIVGRFVAETTREERVPLVAEMRRINHRGLIIPE